MWLVTLVEPNFEGLRKMYKVRNEDKKCLKLCQEFWLKKKKNFGYDLREKLDWWVGQWGMRVILENYF